VIRRELLLDEGEIFNMDMWDRSILRLNQLGYFEMLKKDDATEIHRNPNSNTVDLTLKVKERGKNTVGLNGGVSGVAGSFVGFNYSTNNFLGLGETLSLDSQLGTLVQDVSLGFSEPYLFERPISAGVSVYVRRFHYNQAREASIFAGTNLIPLYNELGTQNLLDYTQDSRGFTVSTGTHLRRSFAQIGISYGYDRSSVTTLTKAAANYFQYLNFTGASGPNALNGIKTSHITPSYGYNTVNHPITPTAGHSVFFSVDFAGSILGGNVNTIRPTVELKLYKASPLRKSLDPAKGHVIAMRLLLSTITGYGGKVAPPFARSFIGGEQDVRGFNIMEITPIAFVPTAASIAVLNADGTPRTQSSIVNGTVQQSPVEMTVPAYQLVTPGGDTQVIYNLEYRIPVFGTMVQAVPFFDFGLDKVLYSHQLTLEPTHIQDLNLEFPQAAFQNRIDIYPGTQKPRASTGLEFQVTLPIIQAPFRIYFAYNPMLVREYLQPPIVIDRAAFPNAATFANSVNTYGQQFPFFERRTMFRFTIGKTF
jgi:outer membrane protein insertion porin family